MSNLFDCKSSRMGSNLTRNPSNSFVTINFNRAYEGILKNKIRYVPLKDKIASKHEALEK